MRPKHIRSWLYTISTTEDSEAGLVHVQASLRHSSSFERHTGAPIVLAQTNRSGEKGAPQLCRSAEFSFSASCCRCPIC